MSDAPLALYATSPIYCEKCGATLAIKMPGGYLRVEYRGREFLVYGGEGAFFETSCGARVRGSDRLCGTRHRFTLAPTSESLPSVASVR